MPKKGDCYYTGKEPSPKGYGNCAHLTPLGTILEGNMPKKGKTEIDNWIVKLKADGTQYWAVSNAKEGKMKSPKMKNTGKITKRKNTESKKETKKRVKAKTKKPKEENSDDEDMEEKSVIFKLSFADKNGDKFDMDDFDPASEKQMIMDFIKKKVFPSISVKKNYNFDFQRKNPRVTITAQMHAIAEKKLEAKMKKFAKDYNEKNAEKKLPFKETKVFMKLHFEGLD